MQGGYRHGKGILTFGPESKELTYKGRFEGDEMHGEGELVLKNGDIYRGKFVQGVLSG